jgi:hypothetical protein
VPRKALRNKRAPDSGLLFSGIAFPERKDGHPQHDLSRSPLTWKAYVWTRRRPHYSELGKTKIGFWTYPSPPMAYVKRRLLPSRGRGDDEDRSLPYRRPRRNPGRAGYTIQHALYSVFGFLSVLTASPDRRGGLSCTFVSSRPLFSTSLRRPRGAQSGNRGGKRHSHVELFLQTHHFLVQISNALLGMLRALIQSSLLSLWSYSI